MWISEGVDSAEDHFPSDQAFPFFFASWERRRHPTTSDELGPIGRSVFKGLHCMAALVSRCETKRPVTKLSDACSLIGWCSIALIIVDPVRLSSEREGVLIKRRVSACLCLSFNNWFPACSLSCSHYIVGTLTSTYSHAQLRKWPQGRLQVRVFRILCPQRAEGTRFRNKWRQSLAFTRTSDIQDEVCVQVVSATLSTCALCGVRIGVRWLVWHVLCILCCSSGRVIYCLLVHFTKYARFNSF